MITEQRHGRPIHRQAKREENRDTAHVRRPHSQARTSCATTKGKIIEAGETQSVCDVAKYVPDVVERDHSNASRLASFPFPWTRIPIGHPYTCYLEQHYTRVGRGAHPLPFSVSHR